MPTIAVIGASGQLGQQFVFMSQFYPMLDFLFFDSTEVDITQPAELAATLDEYDINFVVNCAAYTLVDKAEEEQEKAYLINASGAGYLAAYCRKEEIILLHFSSDYVYHNELNRPLTESDPVSPKGVYAQSKLAGEQQIVDAWDKYLIFRTSWLYSPDGNNFLKSIIRAAKEKDELRVVYDQIGAPTYARDLASKSLRIINGISEGDFSIEDVAGVYNVANAGVTSWYDFTIAILQRAKITCPVKPILSHEYITAASRPHYSVLDQSKFNTVFGFPLAHWTKGLDKCIKAMNEG